MQVLGGRRRGDPARPRTALGRLVLSDRVRGLSYNALQISTAFMP
jgi:hypothetical protein